MRASLRDLVRNNGADVVRNAPRTRLLQMELQDVTAFATIDNAFVQAKEVGDAGKFARELLTTFIAVAPANSYRRTAAMHALGWVTA